jgi:hypothetical protein
MKRLKPGKLLAVMLSFMMITACSSLTAAFADDGAATAADTAAGQQEAQTVDDAQGTSAVNSVQGTVLKTEDPLTAAEDANGLTGENDQNTDTEASADEDEPLHIGYDDEDSTESRIRVRGVVFDDYNFDTFYSKGESGIKNVTVGLYNAAGKKIATTTTNSSGKYVFDLTKKDSTSSDDGKSGHITLVTGGSYSVKVIKKGTRYVYPERFGRMSKMFPNYKLSSAKKYVNDQVVENESDSTGTTVRFTVDKASGTVVKNIGLEETPLSTTVSINWNTAVKPNSVKMILSGDGYDKTITLSAANGWKTEVSNLRRMDPDGNTIHYRVSLVGWHNYDTSISGDVGSGFTVSVSDSAVGQAYYDNTGYDNTGYVQNGAVNGAAASADTEIGEGDGSTSESEIKTPEGKINAGDENADQNDSQNSYVPYLIGLLIAAAVIALIVALARRRRKDGAES